MANAKAMGPDNLSAEASSRILAAFHGIILRIWQERFDLSFWQDLAYGLTVAERKTDTMVMRPPHHAREDLEIVTAGQRYAQTD